jgi:hypothetical protein
MDKIKYRPLYIRLEVSQYKKWRDLAHINELSMAEMIRTLVENKLKETKKELTSSDIAI